MPVRLNGSTSGYVELAAPAVAGSTSLELPTDSIKPGMVLVAAQSFSAVSSVSVDNCFTATYSNYRLTINASIATASGSLNIRLRTSGTDSATGYYEQRLEAYGTSIAASAQSNVTFGVISWLDTNICTASVDFFRPSISETTGWNVLGGRSGNNFLASAYHSAATSYDGITIYPNTSTISGTVRIYGYRNSL
jgi:hypothetical protein